MRALGALWKGTDDADEKATIAAEAETIHAFHAEFPGLAVKMIEPDPTIPPGCACPECERPYGLSHLGTCSGSMMRSGGSGLVGFIVSNDSGRGTEGSGNAPVSPEATAEPASRPETLWDVA